MLGVICLKINLGQNPPATAKPQVFYLICIDDLGGCYKIIMLSKQEALISMYADNLTESEKIPKEILDRATTKPVFITDRSQPSHVLLSASAYNALLDKISTLEDDLWGKRALTARETERSIGQEAFTNALRELAHGET